MTKKVTFLMVALFLSLITMQAQSWTQVGADINGEAAEDYSGYSISLSADGSVVAIGAIENDGNGSNAGQVRVYQKISGTWTQIGADIDGEAADDNSGLWVSLNADGSVVAIGAPQNDQTGEDAGQVRVFQNISGTWTQVGADINGEAAGDFTGGSVSISSDGSIVAIGAIRNDGNGSNAGRVRIYQNISGTWTQVGANIDGEIAEDYFGASVSLSSDGAIVAAGAPYHNGKGSVRIFQNISGTWTQVGTEIEGEDIVDGSGSAISLNSDGTIVAIGAMSNAGNGENAGHVRVYQNISGTWTQVGADIDGEAARDYSGCAVSLSADGSILAIGAESNDGNGNNSGHVRIFKNVSGTWTQVGVDIDGESQGDASGTSVSLNFDGSIVAIGAPWNAENGNISGQVRVFEYALSQSIVSQLANQNSVSIYPNPTSGILNFDFAASTIQKITILGILGREITSDHSLTNNSIDLSNFENGIYVIKIYTNNEIITSKIVKD